MSKKPKLFAHLPHIKDIQVRSELQRAHMLVALLALALIATFLATLLPGFTPNHTLVYIAVVLLALVALFSMSIAVSLQRKK